MKGEALTARTWRSEFFAAEVGIRTKEIASCHEAPREMSVGAGDLNYRRFTFRSTAGKVKSFSLITIVAVVTTASKFTLTDLADKRCAADLICKNRGIFP
jgi:hypothetical protein